MTAIFMLYPRSSLTLIPTLARNIFDNDGAPPVPSSRSIRSTRDIGKNVVLGSTPPCSREAIVSNQDSNASRSIPRTVTPAPERSTRRPKNDCFGESNVTTTIESTFTFPRPWKLENSGHRCSRIPQPHRFLVRTSSEGYRGRRLRGRQSPTPADSQRTAARGEDIPR